MSVMRVLRINENSPHRQLVGVGGLGTGIFFELDGEHTLGRNESRLGRLLEVRDYCKLHIVIHYVAKLLGARLSGSPFHVLPVGNVGQDLSGKRVVEEMRQTGIDTRHVRLLAAAPTLFSVCFQYPDGSGGNITTSNSAAGMLSKSQLEDLGEILRLGGPRTIALAVPEVPLELRRHLLELASRTGAFRAASFATAEVATAQKLGMFELLDLVSLNESEGEQLVGRPFSEESPEPFIEKCQDVLRGSYPQLKVVISAGKAGAYGITAQGHDFSPAHEVVVASTAGAGDSLLGGVLAALAAGIPFLRTSRGAGGPLNGSIETALQLGVLLGSYKCLSPHTIHPDASLDTLIEFAHNRGLEFSGKIESLLVQDEVTQHSN